MAANHDVIQHGQPIEQRNVLEGATNADRRDTMPWHRQDGLAIEQDFTGTWLVQPAQAVEQGGLAGPIRSNQAGNLPSRDVEADVVQGDDAAEA